MRHSFVLLLSLLGCGPGAVHDAVAVDGALPAQVAPVDAPVATAAPVSITRVAASDGACPLKLPLLDHLGVVIHNKVGDKYVIDSTGKTCDREFCAAQSRICCPVAPEGSDLRVPCENAAMGRASDGVFGPEWSLIGTGRVMRHPSNPYLAFAWYPGKVRACVPNQPTVCGEVELPAP